MAANKHRVTIIGGGLAGSSLAYYLSHAGWQVTLLDAGAVGASGATGASRGIVRVYDPQPAIMKAALAGVETWRGLQAMHKGLFTECGCIYLLAAENVADASKALATMATEAYPMEMVQGADAIRTRAPMLRHTDLSDHQWAIWEPRGGYVNTRLAAQVLMQEARQLGAVAMEGVAVTEVTQRDTNVLIHTTDGSFQSDYAVLAVGAGLPELYPASGVFCRTIPLTALHHAQDYADKSCVIDENSKSYLRPEDGQFLFAGGATQQDYASLSDLNANWSTAFKENQALASALLNDSKLTQLAGVAGYDAYTETFEPVIKGFDTDQRIGVFAGFSGRGAKYIPAAAHSYSTSLPLSLKEESSQYA